MLHGYFALLRGYKHQVLFQLCETPRHKVLCDDSRRSQQILEIDLSELDLAAESDLQSVLRGGGDPDPE